MTIRMMAALAVFMTPAFAQDYMLPNAPGKAAVMAACESCHGIMTVIGHGKRAPHQWDEIVHQMIGRGAPIKDADAKTIIAYLSTAYGQANDYVPAPPPVAPPSPGLALALEAAETAQHTCEANGYKKVGTLVVDIQGNTVVWLAGDNSFLNTAVVSGKTAAVLRYKTTSGDVMKRLDSDPALLAAVKLSLGDRITKAMPAAVMGKDLSIAGMFDSKNERYSEAAEFRALVEADVDAAQVAGGVGVPRGRRRPCDD